MTTDVREDVEADENSDEWQMSNENSPLACMFGQQTDWQGGYGGTTGGQEDLAPETVSRSAAVRSAFQLVANSQLARTQVEAGVRVPAEVLEDGTVTCISPDMSGKKEWQQLIVFRDVNGTGTEYKRVSHA